MVILQRWFIALLLLARIAGALERAGMKTALPTTGTDAIFTGAEARYVVTVEAAGARCAVPGDFDGDGLIDLASVSSNDNSVAWYKRLPDGSYGPKNMISRASNGARIVTVGDIDKDGKLDVIVASYYDHTVGWFKNLGGSFDMMRMITRTAIAAQGVSVADLDNDGDLDVISASSGDNTIAWYENMGDGNFCEVKNVVDTKAGGIRTVVATDIDEDGFLDLVSAAKDDNMVAWYRNDGKSNFVKIPIDTRAKGAYSVYIEDVNKDGHKDIVAACNMRGFDEYPDNGEGGMVYLYLNDGTGTFTSIPVTAGNATGTNDFDWFVLSVWAGDLDMDGDVDIASASFALLHQGSISWYENVDGSGTQWTRHKVFETPTTKTGHYVIGYDMDGDGDNDLVATTNGDNTVQILTASTRCDNSLTTPRADCCRADQYWDGSACTSCALNQFFDTGSNSCKACPSFCIAPGGANAGLGFSAHASCASVAGCGNMTEAVSRCDCGQDRFLDKGLATCASCPDGHVTVNDVPRAVGNFNMMEKSHPDQTKYMISDLLWVGFNESRCTIPTCGAGTYFNLSLKLCQTCAAGTFSLGGAIVECKTCPAGSECPYGVVSPIPCQPGFFSGEGAAKCSASPKGMFVSSAGSAKADPCRAGTYSDKTGMNECALCPRGTYAEFNSVVGVSRCTDCPTGLTTAGLGAQALSSCVCQQGTYHQCTGAACKIENSNQAAANFCISCPLGAVCDGPPESPQAMIRGDAATGFVHRPPTVPKGYMSIGADVFKCGAYGDLCPGALMFEPESVMCKPPGGGLACSLCPENSYYNGEVCTECTSAQSTGLGFFFVGAAVAFCILVVATFPAETNGAQISTLTTNRKLYTMLVTTCSTVILTFMQTTWSFTTIEMSWPSQVYAMFAVGGGGFDFSWFGLDCLGTSDPKAFAVANQYIAVLSPAVLFVFVGLLGFIGKCAPRNIIRWPSPYEAVGVSLGLFQTFFLMIANRAVAVGFSFVSHPSGRTSLLRYPYIDETDSQFNHLQVLSTIGIVLWCVGGFSVVCFLLFMLPFKSKSLAFRYSICPITIRFKPDCAWWFLFLLTTNLLVSLAGVISEDPNNQSFFLTLVFLVYGIALCTIRPYVSSVCFAVDGIANLGKLLIVIGGALYEANGSGVEFIMAVFIITGICMFCLLAYAVHQWLIFRFSSKEKQAETGFKDVKVKVNMHRLNIDDLNALVIESQKQRSQLSAPPPPPPPPPRPPAIEEPKKKKNDDLTVFSVCADLGDQETFDTVPQNQRKASQSASRA